MNFGTKTINCSKNIKLHGTYHYLSFAISIRELTEQVKQRKPDITTPSKE